MNLQDKHLLYKIVRARDRRYDGRFYCGVHTTGVYCRPICPARPKIENITFYRSATESQLLGFLRNHQVSGVESMNGERYRRCFAIGTAVGPLDLSFDSKKTQLIVQISISDSTYLRGAIERVRDLFDTRTNPHAHLTDITQSNPVSACYRRELGIRVPGAWDSFETAVCIILGQLVSVEQAREKVKKLVQRFGTKIQNPIFEGCTHLFPTPETLMTADLKEIGLTQVREHALRELSRLVYDKELDLSRSSDLAKTRAQLIGIPGVGPWTVEMIAMRCLGDTNAFPKSDLIIKRALEYHGSQKGDWSPWNAYITIALWKRHATTLSQKNRRPK